MEGTEDPPVAVTHLNNSRTDRTRGTAMVGPELPEGEDTPNKEDIRVERAVRILMLRMSPFSFPLHAHQSDEI